MILVVVLWFVSSLALLVVSFNATVFSATTVIRDEVAASRTATILDGGVALAALRLSQAGEDRWLPDGRAYREVVGGVPIVIRIHDESGKIDLNGAKPELLTRFLQRFTKSPGAAHDLTDAIIKMREAAGAGDPTTGVQGTASPDAAQEGEEEKKADDKRAFIHVTQLLDLPGLTYDIYRKLEPFVTVYNRKGKININTAEREVMLSLPDVTPIEVERMIANRGRAQPEANTSGDLSDRGESSKAEKAGPAYTVVVSQAVAAGGIGQESRATILIGPKLREQFHVLAWQSSNR